MKPPFVRNEFNYDMHEASLDSALVCNDKSRAQQQFKEESDINFIAERYGLNGTMPQVTQPPAYGDFSGVFDFQSAQNAVIDAQRRFMTLPAKMRGRFNNNPGELLAFLEDPDNRLEAEFLGLVPKRPERPQTAPVEPQARPATTGDTLSPAPAPQAPGSPTPAKPT